MSENNSIFKIFKHKLSFVNYDGACTPCFNGIMRKDKTAAILLPTYEDLLNDSCVIRYYKDSFDTSDHVIKEYYRDRQRPIGNYLIKPLVVLF